jgi:hypothetical protein
MKTAVKNLMILSAATLVLGFAATQSAEAGHKRSFGVSAGWGGGGAAFGFSYSRGYRHHGHHRPFIPAPVIVAAPVHNHYVPVSPRRIWVEPVYQQQFVGYDCNGQPIYRTVCVNQGYWRTVY